VLHGDAYTRHVVETQPAKFAAMEAHYESGAYADLHVLAFPTSLDAITDPRAENLWTLSIPSMASWLASGGDPSYVVEGSNSYEGTPPVAFVFWGFRAMVGLGFWFIALALWAGVRWRQGRLFDDDRLHLAMMGSSLLGIVAVEAGWIVTEVGRQPWVIQGVMRTSEGVSPGLTGGEATLTLAGFAVVYLGLLGLYAYVVRRMIVRGPPTVAGDRQRAPTGEEVTTDD
jgi:cytochrome d ubiquinol oxidase subunit I